MHRRLTLPLLARVARNTDSVSRPSSARYDAVSETTHYPVFDLHAQVWATHTRLTESDSDPTSDEQSDR
jgi:hypothetical protein